VLGTVLFGRRKTWISTEELEYIASESSESSMLAITKYSVTRKATDQRAEIINKSIKL
jgi:hypothetical protein